MWNSITIYAVSHRGKEADFQAFNINGYVGDRDQTRQSSAASKHMC